MDETVGEAFGDLLTSECIDGTSRSNIPDGNEQKRWSMSMTHVGCTLVFLFRGSDSS
jgi:hypothetical protein